MPSMRPPLFLSPSNVIARSVKKKKKKKKILKKKKKKKEKGNQLESSSLLFLPFHFQNNSRKSELIRILMGLELFLQ
jgi:hypothetical protein